MSVMGTIQDNNKSERYVNGGIAEPSQLNDIVNKLLNVRGDHP